MSATAMADPLTPPKDPPPTPAAVGPIRSRQQLGELSLLLESQSIPHDAQANQDGYFLLVDGQNAGKSVRAIERYVEENRDWPPRAARERLAFAESRAAPALMMLMAAFFAVTGPASHLSSWFSAGTAVSNRILHGEVWRAVTALTLHSDWTHVLGNVIAGSIFLSAVFRRLGPGRGSFYVLMGGIVGNLANAVLHVWLRQDHRSVGASTAVFAAVGVLAATQLAHNRRVGARTWRDYIMPIAGAFALLAMLGASAKTDLWAHFFGLVAGVVMGGVAVLGRRSPERQRALQVHFGAATAGIVAVSWMIAIAVARHRGLG